jgi:acetyl-CoA carboxylase biotin carboxyl carrier protein
MSAPAVAAPDAPAYAPPPRPAPVQTKPPGKRAAGAARSGAIEIKAQIMGMFYPQPEPGSPPFVSIGAEVKEDTTVCLIEVMKTFNAMTAGVTGVITEICAENAQLVEYGQVLFRIRPS